MNQQQLRKLIQEEIKMILKEGTMTKYTFSGNKNFMSRVAVPIFKKYGIDTAKLKSYDPDTGVTEITVTLDEKSAEKIGNEIENNPRAQDEYGGYMEADEDEMMQEAGGNNFMQHFANYRGTELYNVVLELYMAITSKQADTDQLADMILDLIDAAQRKEREDDYDF